MGLFPAAGVVLSPVKVQFLDLLDDGGLRPLEADRHFCNPDALMEGRFELIDLLGAPVISLAFQFGGSPAHVSDGLCKIGFSYHGKFLLVSDDLL